MQSWHQHVVRVAKLRYLLSPVELPLIRRTRPDSDPRSWLCTGSHMLAVAWILIYCSWEGGSFAYKMIMLMSSLQRHDGLVLSVVKSGGPFHSRAIQQKSNAEDIDPEIVINLFTHIILPPLNLTHPNYGYWKEDQRGAESVQTIRCLGLYCCGDWRWDRHWPEYVCFLISSLVNRKHS